MAETVPPGRGLAMGLARASRLVPWFGVPLARLLVNLRAEDHPRRGRQPILAYGISYLASISKRSRRTVLRARKFVDLGDPVQAVAWALARKRPDLADQVLVEFGHAPRYAVKRRAT